MRSVFFIPLLLLALNASAQPDSVIRNRAWIVGGTNAVLWSGSAFMLNEVWYKDYPKSAFHSFNDVNNWRYMDKYGHVYTAYQLSAAQYTAWRWAGFSRRSSVLLGGSISWGYQMTVEVLDGFSAEWGFSWADVTANTIGAGLFMSQQWWWDEQRFRLKFGYHRSPYAALRPQVLGASFSERLLKDYNAQSYWLSVSPGVFLPNGKFPQWLQLSFGYSADQLLKGDDDLYTLNNFTYQAHSEYALSLDIDWNELPIRRKWLKNLVKPLNAIKLPLPAVYWRNGTCYVGMF